MTEQAGGGLTGQAVAGAGGDAVIPAFQVVAGCALQANERSDGGTVGAVRDGGAGHAIDSPDEEARVTLQTRSGIADAAVAQTVLAGGVDKQPDRHAPLAVVVALVGALQTVIVASDAGARPCVVEEPVVALGADGGVAGQAVGHAPRAGVRQRGRQVEVGAGARHARALVLAVVAVAGPDCAGLSSCSPKQAWQKENVCVCFLCLSGNNRVSCVVSGFRKDCGIKNEEI